MFLLQKFDWEEPSEFQGPWFHGAGDDMTVFDVVNSCKQTNNLSLHQHPPRATEPVGASHASDHRELPWFMLPSARAGATDYECPLRDRKWCRRFPFIWGAPPAPGSPGSRRPRR